LDICQFLVEKGADVNAENNENATQPYAYAYEHALMRFAFFASFFFWNFQWKQPAAFLYCKMPLGRLPVSMIGTTRSPTHTHMNSRSWDLFCLQRFDSENFSGCTPLSLSSVGD
jgi:hypothetical protein